MKILNDIESLKIVEDDDLMVDEDYLEDDIEEIEECSIVQDDENEKTIPNSEYSSDNAIKREIDVLNQVENQMAVKKHTVIQSIGQKKLSMKEQEDQNHKKKVRLLIKIVICVIFAVIYFSYK